MNITFIVFEGLLERFQYSPRTLYLISQREVLEQCKGNDSLSSHRKWSILHISCSVSGDLASTHQVFQLRRVEWCLQRGHFSLIITLLLFGLVVNVCLNFARLQQEEKMSKLKYGSSVDVQLYLRLRRSLVVFIL